MVSEVQPLHLRASGTAFGTMINFLMSFIVGQFFLTLMCNCKAYVFLFFAGAPRPPCVWSVSAPMCGRQRGAHMAPAAAQPAAAPPNQTPAANPRLAAHHGRVHLAVRAGDQGRAHRGD